MTENVSQRSIDFQDTIVKEFELDKHTVLFTTEQFYISSSGNTQTGKVIKTGDKVDPLYMNRLITFSTISARLFSIENNIFELPYIGEPCQITYGVIHKNYILSSVAVETFKKTFDSLAKKAEEKFFMENPL